MPSSVVEPRGSAGKQKQKQTVATSEHQRLDTMPWTTVVQGQTNRIPIIFTPEADFFFVVTLSSVKIFSRMTGQLVSTLSSAASTSSQTSWSGRRLGDCHSANITGLSLNPANPLQLLTCSLDGTIRVWDYLDATLIRTIDIGFPISHMVAHASVKGSVFVALQKPKSSGAKSIEVDPFHFVGQSNSIVQLVSLSTIASRGGSSTRPQSVTRVGKARHTTAMALSADGKHLVLIGKRKIHVARTDALKDGFSKIISDQDLTCLAFHPEDNIFATGDAIGQIRLWYFLKEDKAGKTSGKGVQVAPNTLLHWHAHAVSSLAFSPNGANLVSGGEESVMVLWQLATHNREYVPRLGGASIESLCVLPGVNGREEEYIASLADGSIAFIGAISLKLNRTISQHLIDSSRQMLGQEYFNSLSLPLAIQPSTNHLVLPAGHASTLQFFDTEADKVVSQLEVVPSNRVSRPDEIPLEPSRVERVCFSSAGEWMATIDRRSSSETSLKVWRWDTRGKSYKLSSRIEEPHKGSQVTSMQFSPQSSSSTSPLLLTTGSDNQARTWKKVTQQIKGGRQEDFWVGRSAFDYRQLPIIEACWEPNSSLIAIAHEGFVTIWETASNALQHVFPVVGKSRAILFAGKAGRYIVVLSDHNLMVWDIVFACVAWEVDMDAHFLCAQGEGHFCVLSRQRNRTMVATHSPQHKKEVINKLELPLAVRQVCAGSNVQLRDDLSAPFFYALTDTFDVIRTGLPSSQASTHNPGQAAQSLHGVSIKRRTLFDELIGSATEPESSGNKSFTQLPPATMGRKGLQDVTTTVLDIPSHLLPPISVLFDPLVQHILPKRQVGDLSVKMTSQANSVLPSRAKDEVAEEEATSSALIGQYGFDNLRKVSQMDMSSISALFQKQAAITATTSAKLSNTPGKAANGKTTAKEISGDLTDQSKEPILSLSSPKKKESPRKSNGSQSAPSALNGSRKRKQHVD